MARWLWLACGALALPPLAAQVSIDTLRRGHPRLIALDSDIVRIREQIRPDGLPKELHRRLVQQALAIESAPPVEYKLIGPRLLDKSRTCLERIYTLALLYRIDPQPRYLARALRELRAAAAFPDWNPSHFLDTAEMTHAFAIAYDWLYPALSKSERTWIREAIVDKGLEPALVVYENRRWWALATHNWNQVCNGSIALGALAVAEDEPSRSLSIVRYAVESMPLAMASYAPDGGWAEGPGYWHYATRYTAYLLAGMNTALGTDFGLSDSPGFHRAGIFRIDFTGPSGKTFNYADGSDALEPAEELYWLARRFSQPVDTWQQTELLHKRTRAHALDLIWYQDKTQSPSAAGLPLRTAYSAINVAFLRNSWDDDAVWVGVKGGDNAANHAHLDLGTFVLDALGQRWALDLGADDYNLPQYFGPLRWTYYRNRTESHNTIVIDNENQEPNAKAPLRMDGPAAVVDLAAAYSGKLLKHERRIELSATGTVRIADTLAASQPVEALWGMLTDANLDISGRRAVLKKAGRTLVAEIQSPAGANFDSVSTQPPPPQRQNEGTRKLVVRLPGKVRAVNIAVTLTPQGAGT